MISIITACSRPQNLKTIYKSIDFTLVDKWYIIYDTSKCRTYDLEFTLDTHTNKIIELTCDKDGFAGHPQINYALDIIKDGFVYIMDDDNIFHDEFWATLKTLDPEFIYTWDQNRIQENRILKGNTIERNHIDTSQFIVPRNLIGQIRWAVHKSGGDFRFISQIHKTHADKFKYIPKILCYHNFIPKVKVAICFFGLTRSLEFTLPSIQKYLFQPLKNHGIRYDTFLHTYKISEPYTNPRAGERNLILDADEYKLLEPTYHRVEDKKLISKKIHIQNYRTMGDPWNRNGDFTSLDNHILYLWSQKQLTKMWSESKSKYSHIMICRPDVLYQVPLNIEWFSFTEKKIYIPNFGLSGNMNDRFAIGRPEQMILYGNRFNDALEYSKHKPLASEAYLIATLKKHKIKYEHVNFYFIRLRANMKKNGLDISQIKMLTRRNRKTNKGTRKVKL